MVNGKWEDGVIYHLSFDIFSFAILPGYSRFTVRHFAVNRFPSYSPFTIHH